MQAAIKAIEYYLPENVLTNEQLALEYPGWDADKIESKVGIAVRHIAEEGECSSDLAFMSAQKMFEEGVCEPQEIDFLLFCTQSPDYFLPTTACILQDRLRLPKASGAMDFNLGCSGYIYGLGLAKGLIETGQARNVLLLTAETYSKYIHPQDKSVRTLFGDAAAATLVSGVDHVATDGAEPFIGPFVYGTDGSGSSNLMVPAGGMRRPHTEASAEVRVDDRGNLRSDDNLFMDGPEIFAFSLRTVPKAVRELLALAGMETEEVDLFVFHQANQHMLNHLRKKMKIPEDKFYFALREVGNTVSATIPIALRQAIDEQALGPGQTALIVGFGVGYSWGTTLIRLGG